MRRDILADKLAKGRVGRRAIATWNTRRLPTRLTPRWTNRLFVACQGWWRGTFPLSGDVLWHLADAAAPYALMLPVVLIVVGQPLYEDVPAAMP